MENIHWHELKLQPFCRRRSICRKRHLLRQHWCVFKTVTFCYRKIYWLLAILLVMRKNTANFLLIHSEWINFFRWKDYFLNPRRFCTFSSLHGFFFAPLCIQCIPRSSSIFAEASYFFLYAIAISVAMASFQSNSYSMREKGKLMREKKIVQRCI